MSEIKSELGSQLIRLLGEAYSERDLQRVFGALADEDRELRRQLTYRAMYREQRRVMDAIAAAMGPVPRLIVEASSAMDSIAAEYVAEQLDADLVVVDEALWDDSLRTVREIAARHLPEETHRA